MFLIRNKSCDLQQKTDSPSKISKNGDNNEDFFSIPNSFYINEK